MEPRSYRERVYEAFADTDTEFEGKVEHSLEIGSEYLGLPLGFLTRIDEGIQEIVIVHGEHELIQPGETCPLSEAYCQRTIECDGSLAVQGVSTGSVIPDVAFETFGLSTYIGAKVVVEDEVYGTVCFADSELRRSEFSETERLFIELLARLIGRSIERRNHERELRLKNRAIADARLGVTIADNRHPDTPVVYVNEGFERITGYDAETAVGRNCRFLQGEGTDPDTVARMRERLDAEEPVAVELVNYRKDGTPFWNSLHIDPVTDERGEVTHFMGFQRDITERKRMERLVQLLNRVLRHNMRNDLNVLVGVGDLLQEGTDDQEDLGDTIRSTAEELMELGEAANVLKSIARSERDPGRLEPRELLGTVVGTYLRDFPDATVDVSIRTERAFCAGAELNRAATELVENALVHNPAPEPWVGIEVVDDGEWLELTVTDDGPGISAMEAAVIATGEETPLEHGTGLGLWLVNWIVTRYGGSFQIRPREDDTGTVATVRLPGIDPDTPVEEVARQPTVLFR